LELHVRQEPRFGTPTLAVLLRNRRLGRLARLSLDGNTADPRAVHELVAATSLPSLTALRLNQFNLRPAGVRQLLDGLEARARRGQPGLRALGLGQNGLGATGLRALADSSSLDDLVTLELHDNGFRDADVKILAASPHLRRLTTLDLANNKFGLRG